MIYIYRKENLCKQTFLNCVAFSMFIIRPRVCSGHLINDRKRNRNMSQAKNFIAT